MTLDLVSLGAFTLAAVMLLGSPGPGIAALVAVGRSSGLAQGLRFYAGLQAGLALAAALSLGGLLTLVQAAPLVGRMLAYASAAYLVWIAWKVATAPVGQATPGGGAPATALGGFILGLTNPKAYVAFASLAAAYVLAPRDPQADAASKWAVIVAVIVVVDLAWLWFGGVLGRASLKPKAERALNLVMAAVILATTVFALA